jgi:DNA-binding CsgD family transcriptional regulator
MQRLRQSDVRGVLSFVGEAHADASAQALSPRALELLRDLVPAAAVSWHEWSVPDGRVRLAYASSEPDRTAEVWEEYPRYRHEDPLPGGCEGVGPCPPPVVGRALTIGDVVGDRAFRRSGLYAAICRPLGVDHVLKLFLPVERGIAYSVVFDRGGRDFDVRDRLVADLLCPHLRNLERAARTRRHAAALEAAADEDGELVVVNAARRIELATRRARRLLDRHGLVGEDALVSPQIDVWLRAERSCLLLEAEARVLEVRRLEGHAGAMLVTERAMSAEPSTLTSRELQVLALVAEGRSNAEVAAALWLSPGTVRKHLENSYAKLGVRSRTAAVARLRDVDGVWPRSESEPD